METTIVTDHQENQRSPVARCLFSECLKDNCLHVSRQQQTSSQLIILITEKQKKGVVLMYAKVVIWFISVIILYHYVLNFSPNGN